MSASASRRQFLTLTTAASAAAFIPAALSFAADNIAPAYPLTGGDAWDAFKAYDPATHPDAPFFRSRVKRADRVKPFAATQAHPELKPEVPGGTLLAAYLTLSGPDEDLNRTRYQIGARSRVHVERAWQYQDVVVAWNTTGLVPNPALSDAVHRNGARILGTMFQPDKRMFDGSDLPREAVAIKLVALAKYFGFDGYFVNFESYTPEDARTVQDLIGLMQVEAAKQGLSDFHIQYYNGYTDARAVWPGSPHVDGSPREADAPRANSMMIDQGWSHYGLTRGCCSGLPLEALPLPADLGQSYDPMQVYYGLQLYPGPGYLGLIAPTVISPNSGEKALGGLQVYSAEDGLRKMRRARIDQLKATTSLSAQDQADLADLTDPKRTRASWYHLHDRFWSGQSGNPARNNSPTAEQAAIYGPPEVKKVYTDYEAPGKPTDQLRLPITYGVANFITERSVIGTLPFVTRFNTGEGDRFFREGVEVSTQPWFNLGIQDVLPTWTWWTKPLHGAFDRDHDAAGLLAVDYDFEDAWDGGASLTVSGPLTAENATEIRLYKTKLPVTADMTLGLVLKGGKGGRLSVGLVFEDAPEATEWIAVKGSSAGWRRWKAPLRAYAGRTLAALSLGIDADKGASPYDLHIGELALTGQPAPAPAQPQGFRIEKSRIAVDGQSVELRLNWTFDPAVRHYDLFAETGRTPTWLGRIAGDAYYVESLTRDRARRTRLKLVPCAGVGRPGNAATLTYDWVT
ncbi:endo-beta-N-acetylglucosaminidase [Asticcacaulis sp.]|uniref:endo-beta-N-acetylglucosaminidase n=1 Tax=Asticcacaulis sp. TaxID=1872648 RepID=UPI003F7B8E3F